MLQRVLVTGGAGFIGSHTCVTLLESGCKITVLDNLENSSEKSLERVREILALSGNNNSLTLVRGDIRSSQDLEYAFHKCSNGEKVDAVIHFAGLKSVGESVTDPIRYWDVNVNGSLKLLSSMINNDCKTLVFSSSCTVYGAPTSIPISEDSPISPINPYGETKAAVEDILQSLSTSDPSWRIACLRYFNPVGAHPSGLIGEDPNGIPQNLLPFVAQVAVGARSEVKVFGGDWPTPDGTGIRDYIHVMDLADGHVAALRFLEESDSAMTTFNLGSGQGCSVLDVITAFESASERSIPYKIVDRRAGDACAAVADPQKAHDLLGWKTKRSLYQSCFDAWNWQFKNKQGYLSD